MIDRHRFTAGWRSEDMGSLRSKNFADFLSFRDDQCRCFISVRQGNKASSGQLGRTGK